MVTSAQLRHPSPIRSTDMRYPAKIGVTVLLLSHLIFHPFVFHPFVFHPFVFHLFVFHPAPCLAQHPLAKTALLCGQLCPLFSSYSCLFVASRGHDGAGASASFFYHFLPSLANNVAHQHPHCRKHSDCGVHQCQ